jgi:hypothetical protein
MSKIKSTVWLNFFFPDFVFASLTASSIVFLSKGILKPQANEGLERAYKNIRLSVFVFSSLLVIERGWWLCCSEKSIAPLYKAPA